jgi:hypothetical protein
MLDIGFGMTNDQAPMTNQGTLVIGAWSLVLTNDSRQAEA